MDFSLMKIHKIPNSLKTCMLIVYKNMNATYGHNKICNCATLA